MERREEQQPQPPEGARPRPRRGCAGEAGPVGGALVQRTQVVLLAGEPWGLDGGQTVLNSFAHHVVPGQQEEPPPPEPRRREQWLGAASASASCPGSGTPPPPAASGAPSGRLVFFLCRASSLGGREARLRELLAAVREESLGAPAVLVGVLVQPPPDQEPGALRLLAALLREAFPSPEAGVELHTAVFAPGRPSGALQLRRLSPTRGDSPSMQTLRSGQQAGGWMGVGDTRTRPETLFPPAPSSPPQSQGASPPTL